MNIFFVIVEFSLKHLCHITFVLLSYIYDYYGFDSSLSIIIMFSSERVLNCLSLEVSETNMLDVSVLNL